MALPFGPPVQPMLAKAAKQLPKGDVQYEPKWDGFRCLVFVEDGEVTLQSRNGKPFDRYFPELAAPLAEALAPTCVVDTELVVPGDQGLDFDALSQRIHPAASRVAQLAESTPAQVVVFDVLVLDEADLTQMALRDRRRLLEAMVTETDVVHLSLATTEVAQAEDWFARFEGAGLDGVVAKDLGGNYAPGIRGWIKVKPERTADVVVAGYRRHKDGEGVGSLLLGLFGDGRLQNVGVASSFSAARRRELLEEIAPLHMDDPSSHPWAAWADAEAHSEGRMPGGPSRWNGSKDLSWTPLSPERVAEVRYTQLEARRFRHGTTLLRWRPDRDPSSCTYDQLEVPPPAELDEVFSASTDR